MRYEVEIEGRRVLVDVERAEAGWRVRLDDSDWKPVGGRFVAPGELLLTTSAGSCVVGTHVSGDRVALQVAGNPLFAGVTDPRSARSRLGGAAAQGALRTPMPGVVVRIPVAVGQEVTVGQVIVVVEAMKMENEFKAAIDGIVESIAVEVGQALEANSLLASISTP